MKAIILAGGAGSRLYPMTRVITKQLQPVYDKPMIYYPLSLLMLADIRDILIISTERDTPFIKEMLGDGSLIGLNISYKVQKEPKGLAEAFIIGAEFIGNDDVTMVLGDNLFHGDISFYKNAISDQKSKAKGINARVFGFQVEDPERYGVVEFENETGKVLSIEEKPEKPRSNYAIPGLYIFDSTVIERARVQKPSLRGELEITDLIQTYLDDGSLGVQLVGRGVTWFDTGTPESLLEASSLIHAIEKRQGVKVACPEEIALRMGFISKDQLLIGIESLPNGPYTAYLKKVCSEF